MTTLFRRQADVRFEPRDNAPPAGAVQRSLPNSLAIPASRLWSSSTRPGTMLIRCLAGQVWITQTGSARDVVLDAGQSFATAGFGKVVVQAMTNANISVTSARAADSARCG